MGLDHRLRDALRDDAASVEPDVERHLREVIGRTQRRPSRMFRTFAVATAGLVVVAVVVRSAPADPFAVFQSPAATPAASVPPSDPADRLVGTYRASHAGGEGDRDGLTGDWTLTLGADSTVAATPPEGFAAGSDEPLDRYLYALRDDELYINLFARHLARSCVASGTYRWQLAGERLTLEVEADPCGPRVALLTSQPWERITDGSSSR